MKDYYDVLDIPVTATLDEIKAQYKRLVRIYHPDRFTNPLDKVYAEHKLKELNQAYSVLTTNAKAADADEPSRPMPIPIVEPAVLEFGSIAVGQRHATKFKVGNAGGPTKNISFIYNDDHSWYSIARVRQLYPDKSFPVEVEVTVNPNKLVPSHKYQSWFDVNMDGATSRIELRLQTKQQSTQLRWLSHRLALVTATCLLIIALTLTIPWARSLTVAFGLPAIHSLNNTELVSQMDTPVAAPLAPNSSSTIDWNPVFSPDQRQVAFISSQLGTSQIFIRDPLSGRLRQLTQGVEEKRGLTWSPDSRQLAFITRDAGRSVVQILLLSSNDKMVFAPEAATGKITTLLWSLDGESLFFDLQTIDEQQYYEVNLKTQQVAQVSTPPGWQ